MNGNSSPITLRPMMPALLLALVMVGNEAQARPSEKGWERDPVTVEFASDRETYLAGEHAVLTWSSTNARFCSASGAWEGKLPSSGTYTTPGLSASTTYSLQCGSGRGAVAETLVITVTDLVPAETPATTTDTTTTDPTTTDPTTTDPTATDPTTTDPTPAPVPAPTLSFASTDSVVASGGSVTLTWTAENASGCTASGGWFGTRNTSGSETIGPLYASTSYSLSCVGDGGSVVGNVRVDALGRITLAWAAPTENVDGSPLTDLWGYRIYFGIASREYTNVVEVADPGALSQQLDLSSGDYYVAMTALDGDGNESAYSNEVLRNVP